MQHARRVAVIAGGGITLALAAGMAFVRGPVHAQAQPPEACEQYLMYAPANGDSLTHWLHAHQTYVVVEYQVIGANPGVAASNNGYGSAPGTALFVRLRNRVPGCR